jgi:hypothetical protein
MNAEFQQYRFARIEGQNIARERLEAQFKNGIVSLDELETAIGQQLEAASTSIAPWRKSDIEKAGYRDGMRMAALEFFWSHRQEFRCAGLDDYVQRNPTADA